MVVAGMHFNTMLLGLTVAVLLCAVPRPARAQLPPQAYDFAQVAIAARPPEVDPETANQLRAARHDSAAELTLSDLGKHGGARTRHSQGQDFYSRALL